MLYGKRANYDLAIEFIRNGYLSVDAAHGRIFNRWGRPIGSVREGYERVRLGNGPHVSSHRVVWEFINGVSDLNLTINHINGNTLDNRIGNLEIVSNQQNSVHGHQVLGRGNGSRNRGADNPRAKLDEGKVREIRRRLRNGETGTSLAIEFGVHVVTISSIKHGKLWNWVE